MLVLVPLRAAGHVVRQQSAGPGLAQPGGALRAAAVQVDRRPRTVQGPVQGGERCRVDHLVDGAGEQRQRGERGRSGEHDAAAQAPAHPAERGDRGEQVPEPEGAQDDDVG